MYKNAFFTFTVKTLAALFGFLIAVITARYLGAEGRGVISVFVLNISMVFMISSLVGGPGLIFLASRQEAGSILGASMVWALASSILVPAVIWATGFAGGTLVLHLVSLSFLQFVVRIHQNWLLAKEKIVAFNLVAVVYPLAMTVCLVIFFKGMRWHSVDAFITAYYIAVALGLVLSSAYMIRHKAWLFSWRFRKSLTASLRFGYVVQSGNLLQLLNYRFSYYLLQTFYDKAQVGLYSMATAFTEASWMIANSFATVQYSRISNSANDAVNARLTVTFLRMAFWLTLVPVTVLLLLPAGFYRLFLGDEFAGIPQLIPWLAPGILFVAISIVISHYFSGSGNPRVGFIGSAAGFVATLAAGFILVPRYGIVGAAITATISYGITAAVMLFLFCRKHRLRWKDIFLSPSDLREMNLLEQLHEKSDKP